MDTKERLGLRFVSAHDAAGRQWPVHYLRPEAVEAVPGDADITSPALNVMCLQQHVLAGVCRFCGSAADVRRDARIVAGGDPLHFRPWV